MKAPFTCKYCGQPSFLEPIDQTPPPDYCHPEDHGQPPNTETEIAENYLDLMDTGRMPLKTCVTILNQLKKGAYSLKARTNRDLNEITLELWESSIKGRPVATAYIDRGHTRDDRKAAAAELAGTARAYLRLNT